MINSSLFQKFEGVIWGALLGEILGNQRNDPPENLILAPSPQEQIHRIKQGLTDYLNPPIHSPQFLENLGQSSESFQKKLTQVLPVILLCHERLGKLTSSLENFCEKQAISEIKIDLFLFGKSLAKILHPSFIPSQLLPELIQTPELPEEEQEKLITLEKLLKRKTNLQKAIVELNQPSKIDKSSGEKTANFRSVLLLALYSFLSTPEDFRLSLMRGYQTGYDPSLIGWLIGVLSGGYNSSIGIPVDEVCVLAKQVDLTHVKDLTQKLFSLWVGIDEVNSQQFPWGLVVEVPPVLIK